MPMTAAGEYIPPSDGHLHHASLITPREIAELAKAGVKIDWSDVKDHLGREQSCDHQYLVSPDGSFRPNTPDVLLSQLEFRMRWPEKRRDGMLYQGPSPVFEFIAVHKLNDDKVVIFVAHKGEALTLTDDWALYPSDALITQLRLLENT